MAITFEMRGRDGSAGLGPASQSLLDHAAAFRSARRHSLLVRALRIGLPVLTLGAAASYLVALNSAWKIGPGQLNVGQVELTADDLSMKNPSYFGVTKDGGRYQVRAKRAVVEFSRQQTPIKLIDVDGDLIRANNVSTKLKAKHGLLDSANSRLELYDGIEIDSSNGMAARLSRATIKMKEHHVISREPVTASTPTGSVRAAAMNLRTDTQEATFEGSVAVRLAGGGSAGAGFGRDGRQPIDVSAERLDVNDAAKTARFTDNVTATQGDSTLKAPELTVSYEGKAASAQLSGDATSAAPKTVDGKADAPASRLSGLFASKGVVITAGADRRVSSQEVDFDAKADTALFTGGVVVNQGRNLLNGRRLFVDRKAGKSRLDAPPDAQQPQGRITASFHQPETKSPASKPKAPAAEAASAVQEQLFGSFKTDPNAPIDVEADSLEVNDPVRQAIFHTNVRAQQGDFVLRTVELMAFYSGQSGLGLGTGPAGDKTPAQLTRIEAKQKVLITSKDGQTATGDWANFDVKANTVVLGGRVVVTRGKDVAEGPRLKIDLTTGMYRFENEGESAGAGAGVSVPAVPADAAKAGADTDPSKRACPAGKQCALIYPKDAKDRAKEVSKKVLPHLPTRIGEGWQSTTGSGEPGRRGD